MFKRHSGRKLLHADMMIRIMADFTSEDMQAKPAGMAQRIECPPANQRKYASQ